MQAFQDEQRTQVIEQAAYLMDEVRLLQSIVHRVPEILQTVRPLDKEPSIREYYGLVASRTEQLLRTAKAMKAGSEPVITPHTDDVWLAEAHWNEQPLEEILDIVVARREALVELLEEIPLEQWTVDLEVTGGGRTTLLHRTHNLIQEDARYLREVGYRLHESHLTDRDKDLPK